MARGETRRDGYLKSLRRRPLPTPRCATCRCCTGKRALARTCVSCCLSSWGAPPRKRKAVAIEAHRFPEQSADRPVGFGADRGLAGSGIPDMWALQAHGSGVSFGWTPPQRHWWSYGNDPLPTGA
jgi:hypothetical protein